MRKIQIPEKVMPGFKILAYLNDNQIVAIVDCISSIDIGISLAKLRDSFATIVGLNDATPLLQTITSFSELLAPENVDKDELINNLIDSYKSLSKDQFQDSDIERLIRNLKTIIYNYSKLKLTIKAKELTLENECNLTEARIITDLRFVFEENLQAEDKRAAIVLHRLHLEFDKSDQQNDIFITMDLEDLEKLKIQVERAISKEKVIKEDYSKIFSFTNS